MDDIWNARREKLQREAVEAINALTDHMGSKSFVAPLGDGRFLAVGTAPDIQRLVISAVPGLN